MKLRIEKFKYMEYQLLTPKSTNTQAFAGIRIKEEEISWSFTEASFPTKTKKDLGHTSVPSAQTLPNPEQNQQFYIKQQLKKSSSEKLSNSCFFILMHSIKISQGIIKFPTVCNVLVGQLHTFIKHKRKLLWLGKSTISM